jgi:hypothetical protein
MSTPHSQTPGHGRQREPREILGLFADQAEVGPQANPDAAFRYFRVARALTSVLVERSQAAASLRPHQLLGAASFAFEDMVAKRLGIDIADGSTEAVDSLADAGDALRASLEEELGIAADEPVGPLAAAVADRHLRTLTPDTPPHDVRVAFNVYSDLALERLDDPAERPVAVIEEATNAYVMGAAALLGVTYTRPSLGESAHEVGLALEFMRTIGER